jgi:hypothetical protein
MFPPPGIKHMWSETCHSWPLTSPTTKVKNKWSNTSAHPMYLQSTLRGNFTCTLHEPTDRIYTLSPLNLNHYFLMVLSSHLTLGLPSDSFCHIFQPHFHTHPISICATYFSHLITLHLAILIPTAQDLQCVDGRHMTSSYVCSLYMHYVKNSM